VFTNIGMNVLLFFVTCGVWSYYVFYQLMRRMRDHNARRLEMLEGANELAWQQANARGLGDELRPNFERIAGNLAVLRGLTTEFRDPALWLVIAIFSSGIGLIIGFVFLDQDLVKHDAAEGAVEAELAAIFTRLGHPLPAPDPGRQKGNHNYGGRIAAYVLSCGFYGLWWYCDLMREPNRHFEHNWAWDDALAGAVQQTQPAA